MISENPAKPTENVINITKRERSNIDKTNNNSKLERSSVTPDRNKNLYDIMKMTNFLNQNLKDLKENDENEMLNPNENQDSNFKDDVADYFSIVQDFEKKKTC